MAGKFLCIRGKILLFLEKGDAIKVLVCYTCYIRKGIFNLDAGMLRKGERKYGKMGLLVYGR